jgi:hypothetical protein
MIEFDLRLGDAIEAIVQTSGDKAGWVALFLDWGIPIGVATIAAMETSFPLAIKILLVILTLGACRLFDLLIGDRWPVRLFWWPIMWLNAKLARGMLGEHTLEIQDHALVETTPSNRFEKPWPKVGPIETNGPYTLIYVRPVGAHIVPHDRVTVGDVDSFVEEVRARCAATAG